jgi:hypothetical protein
MSSPLAPREASAPGARASCRLRHCWLRGLSLPLLLLAMGAVPQPSTGADFYPNSVASTVLSGPSPVTPTLYRRSLLTLEGPPLMTTNTSCTSNPLQEDLYW